jgi:hypothetical protein
MAIRSCALTVMAGAKAAAPAAGYCFTAREMGVMIECTGFNRCRD